MARIVIEDLAEHEDLDDAALAAISGGRGWYASGAEWLVGHAAKFSPLAPYSKAIGVGTGLLAEGSMWAGGKLSDMYSRTKSGQKAQLRLADWQRRHPVATRRISWVLNRL